MSIQIGIHHNISEYIGTFNNQKILLYSDVQSNLIEMKSGCNETFMVMNNLRFGSSNNGSNLYVDTSVYSTEEPTCLLNIGKESSLINTELLYFPEYIYVASNLNINSLLNSNLPVQSISFQSSNLVIYADPLYTNIFQINSNSVDLLSLKIDKNLLYIRGNVGIGTSIPKYKLHVDGGVYTSDGIYMSSINPNISGSTIFVNSPLDIKGRITARDGFNFGNTNLALSHIVIKNILYDATPAIRIEQHIGYQPISVINIVNPDDTKTTIQGITSSGRNYIGVDVTDSTKIAILESKTSSNTPALFTIGSPYSFSNDHLIRTVSYDSSNMYVVSKDAYVGIGTDAVYHPLHFYMNSNTNMIENPLSNMATIGIYHEYMPDKPFFVANSNNIRVFFIDGDGSLIVGSNEKIVLGTDGSIVSKGTIQITENISCGSNIVGSNIILYDPNSSISFSNNASIVGFGTIEADTIIAKNIYTSNIISSNITIYGSIITSNLTSTTININNDAIMNNVYIEGYLTGPYIQPFKGTSTNTLFIPNASGSNSISHFKSSNVLISILPNYSSQINAAIVGNSNAVLQVFTYPMNSPISSGISVYGNERSSMLVTADKPYYQLSRHGSATYNIGINANNDLIIGLSNSSLSTDYTMSMITLSSNITNGYCAILGNGKTLLYARENGSIFISSGTEYDPVLSQSTGGFEVKAISYFRSLSGNAMLYMNTNGSIGIGKSTPVKTLDIFGDMIISQNVGISTNIPQFALDVRGNTIISRNIGIGTTIPRAALDVFGNVIISSNIGIGTSIPCGSLHVEGSSIFVNGNIGIGTTSSMALMHIHYTGNDTDILRIDDSIAPDNSPFIIDNNGNVGIGTNITREKLDILGKMIISSNIGIGTTIPLSRLHVEGNGIFMNGNIGVGTSIPLAVMHMQYNGNTIDLLRIDTTNNKPFVIKNDKKVGVGLLIPRENVDVDGDVIVSSRIGIGTTIPLQSLHVEGNIIIPTGNIGIGTTIPNIRSLIYGIGSTSISPSTSTNLGATISIQDTSNIIGSGGMVMFGANNGYYAAIKGALQNNNSNTTGDMIIATRNTSTDTELTLRLSITSNGNIGINTTSPIANLHVGAYGNSYVESTLFARNFRPAFIGSWLPKMFSMPGGSSNYVNVSLGNTDASGFDGGFTDGRYAYLVPLLYNVTIGGNFHGIFTRVDLQNYTTTGVSYVNVASGNSSAEGFIGGFTDSRYAYLVPYRNGISSYHGIFTRVDLENYNTTNSVSYLDVSTAGNTNAKGFYGGFTDGRYAYLVPYQNNNNNTNHGILTRVDLSNYNTTNSVSYVDVSFGNTNAKGFRGGFTDGRYAYLVPSINDTNLHGILTRVDLQNYTTTGVSYFNVSTAGNTNAKGFSGGFTDGRYAYMVPQFTSPSDNIVTRVMIGDIYPSG